MKRWVVAGLLGGCQPATSAPPPEPPAAAGPDAPTDDASAQASAAPQAGSPIELDIPLVSGDAEPLSALRGKAVVILLSSSDRPGWSAFRAHYEARLAELGRARLVVVAVANDADPKQLLAEWDRDPPPFLLGWDPAGALALRLGIATLPAAFVLDPQGHLQGSVASADGEAFTQLDAWIDAVVPPPLPRLEPDPESQPEDPPEP